MQSFQKNSTRACSNSQNRPLLKIVLTIAQNNNNE